MPSYIRIGLLHLLCLWYLFSNTIILHAQQRTTHYDEQNGLLSDFTYGGMFDRNNYLWICSSRGLSRFNGTDFSHFTVKEGLPDNDVVDVQEDEDGVIWVTAFHRESAFLEPGKTLFTNINTIIHPDTVKRDGTYEIFTLKDHTIALVSTKKMMRLVRNKRWIKSYPIPSGILFHNKENQLVILGTQKISLLHPSGKLDTLPQPYPYFRSAWRGNLLWLYCKDNSLVCIDTRKGEAGELVRKIKLRDSIFRFGTWGDSILISEKNGRFISVNSMTGAFSSQKKTPLLSGTAESEDSSIRVLFTRDEGIYVQVRADNSLYRELPAAPYSLLRRNNTIEVLDAQNRWLFPERLRGTQIPVSANRVNAKFTEIRERKIWIYGFDVHVINHGGSSKNLDNIKNVKDVYLLNDSIRYIACHHGAFVLNCLRQTQSKLYNKRTCCISEGADTSVYMGTQRGLLQRFADGRMVDWCDRGFPEIRVTDLTFKYDVLWIATGGKGLWAIRRNRLYHLMDESKGLVSDAIEAIAADGGGHVLLGYAKGIQRLTYDLQGAGIQLTDLQTLHTIKGEGVKYLHYVAGKVYGMGSRGLLVVPEQLQEAVKNFRIQIDRVLIDGVPTEFNTRYQLSPGTHDFSVKFSTVNYEQFPVRYRYRNNDEAWTYTSEPEISYHSLKPGDYRFEIQVLNNYGKPSSVQVIQVEVRFPFYLRSAFIMTSGGLLLILLIASVRFWYRYQYRKNQKALQQETRLRELELTALKAQINPHFVFNCLNSIKALIYEHQLEEADLYMDHFARLFRSTLEGATMPYHSLAKEIDFIHAYLSLEQVNVNNRFEFNIELQREIQVHVDTVMLPSMLLQPYVENAVKHGVSRLKERKGQITVRFKQHGGQLICTIIDNGPGRDDLHNKRDGKGMKITGKRAQLYHIQTEVTDHVPSGTVVRLLLTLKTSRPDD